MALSRRLCAARPSKALRGVKGRASVGPSLDAGTVPKNIAVTRPPFDTSLSRDIDLAKSALVFRDPGDREIIDLKWYES